MESLEKDPFQSQRDQNNKAAKRFCIPVFFETFDLGKYELIDLSG